MGTGWEWVEAEFNGQLLC